MRWQVLLFVVFFAAEEVALADMVHTRGTKAREARRERALRLGYLTEDCAGKSHVEVSRFLKPAAKTVVAAMEKHAELDEKNETSHHHLAGAALTAVNKDKISADEFQSAILLNKRAGKAKHEGFCACQLLAEVG